MKIVLMEENKMLFSEEQPIILILTDTEKECIASMGDQTLFACFPKEYSREKIKNKLEEIKRIEDKL